MTMVCKEGISNIPLELVYFQPREKKYLRAFKSSLCELPLAKDCSLIIRSIISNSTFLVNLLPYKDSFNTFFNTFSERMLSFI